MAHLSQPVRDLFIDTLHRVSREAELGPQAYLHPGFFGNFPHCTGRQQFAGFQFSLRQGPVIVLWPVDDQKFIRGLGGCALQGRTQFPASPNHPAGSQNFTHYLPFSVYPTL